MLLFSGFIPSNINRIEGIIGKVISIIEMKYGEVDRDILFSIRVALNEIVINAVKHGNKEDEGKSVMIEAVLDQGDKVHIAVQDEGGGYDLDNIFKGLDGICDPEKFGEDISAIPECGRGLQLARGLCDSLSMDAQGRTVMTMKLKKA